ncbi:MAG: nuclear transport factor 2 family protein [Armatimonadota bacterium]|nr:nuclear transport factor 2 family protein [Armatimonadota bacterium]
MQRSSKIALGLAALLLAILVMFFVLRQPPPPDQDQIIAQLEIARAAGEQNSAGGVLSIVSPDFSTPSGVLHNKQQLGFYLYQQMKDGGRARVTLSPPSVVVQGDTATSACQITVRSLDSGQVQFDKPVTLTWRKEDGRRFFVVPTKVWRIVGIQGDLPGGED